MDFLIFFVFLLEIEEPVDVVEQLKLPSRRLVFILGCFPSIPFM